MEPTFFANTRNSVFSTAMLIALSLACWLNLGVATKANTPADLNDTLWFGVLFFAVTTTIFGIRLTGTFEIPRGVAIAWCFGAAFIGITTVSGSLFVESDRWIPVALLVTAGVCLIGLFIATVLDN